MSDTHLVEDGSARERRRRHEGAGLNASRRKSPRLVTSGPQGVTGYATGRPKVLPIFGYWPCRIDRSAIKPKMHLL